MFSHVARLRAKKGFTLVEIIVVVAIIGILTAMILPNLVYNRRPATGKAMAKELYYNIQDVLTSAEIAKSEEIPAGTYAYYYFELLNTGMIGASGRVKSGGSGFETEAYKDDLLLDKKIKYAAEHYTTDKDMMEGTLLVAVDSSYRVSAAYWTNEALSNLGSATIRDDCVLSTDNYLCSFPIKYCETTGSKVFVF